MILYSSTSGVLKRFLLEHNIKCEVFIGILNPRSVAVSCVEITEAVTMYLLLLYDVKTAPHQTRERILVEFLGRNQQWKLSYGYGIYTLDKQL